LVVVGLQYVPWYGQLSTIVGALPVESHCMTFSPQQNFCDAVHGTTHALPRQYIPVAQSSDVRQGPPHLPSIQSSVEPHSDDAVHALLLGIAPAPPADAPAVPPPDPPEPFVEPSPSAPPLAPASRRPSG
jgi:hypothetical protein